MQGSESKQDVDDVSEDGYDSSSDQEETIEQSNINAKTPQTEGNVY